MSRISAGISTILRAAYGYSQQITEPHPSITNSEERIRSRLLNSLVILYMPFGLFVLGFHFLNNPSCLDGGLIRLLAGLALVLFIHILGRSGHYRASMLTTMTLGFALIYVNAWTSDPPYIEIAYLVLMPLLGLIMLSRHEVAVIYMVSILLLLLFFYTAPDVEREVALDQFSFLLIAQGFTLFASFQRNRLEAQRSELMVEQEKNVLVRQLLSNLSHDFRTPLSIIGTSSHLLRYTTDPARQAARLDQIDAQTQRLVELLDSVVTISKLDLQSNGGHSTVNLSDLTNCIIEQARPTAAARNIKIATDIDRSILIVGNSEELEHMAANLIQNAISYTPTGGTVAVQLTVAVAGQVQLLVRDTGIGIDTENLPRIFDRFYRADSSRSVNSGGSGLGLAIVKAVVARHGGHIHVESTPGQGTTFCVILPADEKS